MIFRILKDVKEGHYFWMRKKNTEEVVKIANFGVIFLTLLVYYGSLFILASEVLYRYTGKQRSETDVLTNLPLILGPYLAIYFLFVFPKLRGKIDEDIPEIEKRRKKKVATIYFILCALAIPVSGIIVNFLNGHW